MTTEEKVLTEEERAEQAEALELQEALKGFDDSMPTDFENEVMAGELSDLLANYSKGRVAQKAARQAEDHKTAEALGKNILILRNNIALIQHRYSEAKALADAIMKARARQLKANRARE